MLRSIIIRRLVAGLLAGTLLSLAARADVVELKDGRKLEGTVVSETASEVVLSTGLGELRFARADVARITRGKTPRQEFAEREKAAGSADELHALGEWAVERKLPSLARRAWKRALKLDPRHAESNLALGNVLHEGEWMKPAQRDERVRAAFERSQREQGLVLHEGEWVRVEDKQRLERGLVEVDGAWVSAEEAKRLAGLESFRGTWMPRAEAVARTHAARVELLSGASFQVHVTADALVAGTPPMPWIEELGAALARGRAWFDGAFAVEPGLDLYGGALAEIYVFGADSEPYARTTEHFASLTPTVPEGWSEAVQRMFGLYWIDPYPLSSARAAHRPLADLAGHCLHHLGHLMLGRLGYDGRLLAPWYEESLAALVEFRVFARNVSFCRAHADPLPGQGTGAGAGAARFAFDGDSVRNGRWVEILQAALAANALPTFERLAQKQFSELELLDVAHGMGYLTWLEGREAPAGGSALRAFHDVLRARAPALPDRMHEDAHERRETHELAFRAATGLGLRAADEEWRTWLRNL